MILDLDHWQEIKAALAANKLRTALTAFGVFWGIFLLLVMLAASHGLANGVLHEFAGSATNALYFGAGRTGLPYKGMPMGRPIELTVQDVEVIRERVPEVAVLAPRNGLGSFRNSVSVTRASKSGGFIINAGTPQILKVETYHTTAGRFLNPLDLLENRKVAVIGSSALDVLFEKGEDPIGQPIEINGVYFRVIGVFTPFFSSGFRAEMDAQTIFVPFTTFQRAFGRGDKIDSIAATARDGERASVAEEKVLALLKRRHRVAPQDTRAFWSDNAEEEYDKLTGLFEAIAVLVWIVGAGTLAAGAIGVSNIMLIVVKERTKEIGIRRAIGARPVTITTQVVFEAVVLTTVAGYLGLVAGIALIEVVGRVLVAAGGSAPEMFRNPGVELTDALQALAILVGAGVVAGLVPALQAIRVSPVMALRAE